MMEPSCAEQHDRQLAYRVGMEDGYSVTYLARVWPGICVEAYVAGYQFGVTWADLETKWREIARSLEPDDACTLSR